MGTPATAPERRTRGTDANAPGLAHHSSAHAGPGRAPQAPPRQLPPPPPTPAPPPLRPTLSAASSSPGGRVYPGDCLAPGRRAAAGEADATLGRRRGRGAGAQMGATEKGGKKSRRLFSSLRPWKATRRLWRTRSAPTTAQGECGRGRGPVTSRGRRWPSSAATRAELSAPGTCGPGRHGLGVRPGASAPRPSAVGTGQPRSSPGADRPSAGASLVTVTVPSLPPPLGSIRVSRWPRWLVAAYFPQKSSPARLALDRRNPGCLGDTALLRFASVPRHPTPGRQLQCSTLGE